MADELVNGLAPITVLSKLLVTPLVVSFSKNTSKLKSTIPVLLFIPFLPGK